MTLAGVCTPFACADELDALVSQPQTASEIRNRQQLCHFWDPSVFHSTSVRSILGPTALYNNLIAFQAHGFMLTRSLHVSPKRHDAFHLSFPSLPLLSHSLLSSASVILSEVYRRVLQTIVCVLSFDNIVTTIFTGFGHQSIHFPVFSPIII